MSEFWNLILAFIAGGSGGAILVFGAYTTPEYVAKASGAYTIYQNASSAGVGSSSLKFLIEKSGAYLFELSSLATQIFTGDDIVDHVENNLINK